MNFIKYIMHGFRKSKVRTTLAVVSVFFTFTMMLIISLFFSSAQEIDFESVDQQVSYDIQIERTDNTDLDPSFLRVDRVLKEVDSRDDIQGVYPIIRGYGYTTRDSIPDHFFQVFGVVPEYQTGYIEFQEGIYDLSPGKCVISTKTAYSLGERMGKERATVGDSLSFTFPTANGMTDMTVVISGVIDISGRFQEDSSYQTNPYVVLDIGYLQDRAGLQNMASHVLVTVDQDLYDLSDPTNPARSVERIAIGLAKDLGEEYDVSAPKAAALNRGTTNFLTSLSYLFAILFPAISGILVASVMGLSVEEKTQELATLRLLGARRTFVGKVVVAELFTILFIGIVPALIFGPLVAKCIVWVAGLDFELTSLSLTTQVALQLLIAVLVTVLFSLSPIMKALKTNPAESINRIKSTGAFRFVSTERVDKKLVLSGWFVFGAMMVSIMSVVFLIRSSGDDNFCLASIGMLTLLPVSLTVALLGGVPYLEDLLARLFYPITSRTNKIIRSYIKRNVRRNVSTNLIFGTIVAILIMFTSIFSSVMYSSGDSIRSSLGSDIRIFVDQSGLTEDDISVIGDIEGVSSISAVTGPWFLEVSDLINRKTATILTYGIDENFTEATYNSRTKYQSGTSSDLKDLGEDGIAISGGLAKELEIERGDRISMAYQNEGISKKMFFEVKAVLIQVAGFSGIFSEEGESMYGSLLSEEGFDRIYSEFETNATYSSLFIDLGDLNSRIEVMDILNERFGAVENVYVIDTTATIIQSTIAFVFLQSILTVISSMLLVVAIFSLVINLYASVKEREYEIGVLKSMGLRRFEILKSLMVEGTIISLVSMVLGIVAGTAVAALGIYAFNSISIVNFRFIPPYWIVAYLVGLTILFGIAGSFLPAILVSRKPVINLMKKIE